MKKLLIILILVLLNITTIAQAKIFEVTITNPNYRPIYVGVWGFKTFQISNTKLVKKLNRTITRDINISSMFYIDKSQKFSYEAPASLVAGLARIYKLNYVIYGNLYTNNETIYVHFKIVDVANKKVVVNQLLSSNLQSLRWVGHKIIDELIKFATGVYGPFESMIVFSAGNRNTRNIYISDFDGENMVQLTKWNTMNILPKWINKNTIAFLSYQNEYPVIYTLNIATGKAKKLFFSSSLSITPVRYKNDFALPFEKNEDVNIFVINKYGRAIKSLTNSYSINVSPSFTSDYTKMVFVSNRLGGPQIFIKNLDDNIIRRLTYNGNYNTSSVVSPNNRNIAYISLNNSMSHLNIMNLNGLKSNALVSGYSLDSPSWAYDSMFIVFEGTINGRKGIYVLNTLNNNYSLVINKFKMYNGVSVGFKIK